jgi:hypothetical protein
LEEDIAFIFMVDPEDGGGIFSELLGCPQITGHFNPDDHTLYYLKLVILYFTTLSVSRLYTLNGRMIDE